ncbi:hypothetical protein E2C01_006988 [Portunus trituberculatus]|uniref:Uncharacterized protein n=1 Tax=Portunus trituberculatus TaxID=210409 RepID=A0A5B7CY92_PORTR|nr:hypothetical protein [Portunus trituberculatus]
MRFTHQAELQCLKHLCLGGAGVRGQTLRCGRGPVYCSAGHSPLTVADKSVHIYEGEEQSVAGVALIRSGCVSVGRKLHVFCERHSLCYSAAAYVKYSMRHCSIQPPAPCRGSVDHHTPGDHHTLINVNERFKMSTPSLPPHHASHLHATQPNTCDASGQTH